MAYIDNKKIIFFGDSITDAGRFLNPDYVDGAGYFNMLKTNLAVFGISNCTLLLNKGISGHKTDDLLARISEDVLQEKPDIVFLLIGINDVWHPFEAKEPVDYTKIMHNYREIIKLMENCGSQVVILKPFLLPKDEFFTSLMPEFQKLFKLIEKEILEHHLVSIDLYQILKQYEDKMGHNVSDDGVHPNLLGHAIIAQTIKDYLLAL